MHTIHLDNILIPEKEENLEGLDTLKLLLQGKLKDVAISGDRERVTKQMSPIVSTAWELGKCVNCCEEAHWIDNLEHKELMKLLLSSGRQEEDKSPIVSVSCTWEKRVAGGKEYQSVYFNLPICQECFTLRNAAKQLRKKANIISAVVFVGTIGVMFVLVNSTSLMDSASATTGFLSCLVPILMVMLVGAVASWKQKSLFAPTTPLLKTNPAAELKTNPFGKKILRFRNEEYGGLLKQALQDAGLIHTDDSKNVARR